MPNPIIFPSDLRELSGELAFPQIEFTVQQDAAQGGGLLSIYLPMPGGVSFSDGGNYESMDLGEIAAGGGIEALARALSAGSVSDLKSLSGTLDNMVNQQIGAAGTRAKAILASILPGVDKDTAMFAMKKIKAPNQNTTFKGNTMRNFTFAFKLIATSSKDTDAIREIHNTFRRYTYAGSSDNSPNIILDYPPIWKIRFLQGSKENEFMPKIFSCYLESFQCTFNGDANVFRYDGSPFDISCQITFKETRTLTRNDIVALESGKSDRGIASNGLASPTITAGVTKPPIRQTVEKKLSQLRNNS